MGKKRDEKKFIARVYKNRSNGQKLITIPKKIKEIKPGDFVAVERIGIIVE